MRDAQKELGVMIGVHFAKFGTEVVTTETGQTVRSSASTPLPVIGAHASIFLGEKSSLNAKVQIFRTDFDNYDGSLNYATLDFQHRVSENIRVGLGYNFYGMKLSSRDDRLNGYLEMRHHWPHRIHFGRLVKQAPLNRRPSLSCFLKDPNCLDKAGVGEPELLVITLSRSVSDPTLEVKPIVIVL